MIKPIGCDFKAIVGVSIAIGCDSNLSVVFINDLSCFKQFSCIWKQNIVFQLICLPLNFCQQDMNAFGPQAAWTGLLGKWKMLNGIVEMHWDETVNKYYILAKALLQAQSVASVASRLCWGDNLANTLVMKKRGGGEVGRGIWGEAAGALIVPTPTLTHKYPTPMSLSRHNTIQIPYKYKYKYHTSTPHLCWGVNCPDSHTPINTPHLCPHKSHHLCISQISSKISDKYPTHQTKDCFKLQSTNKGNGGNRWPSKAGEGTLRKLQESENHHH